MVSSRNARSICFSGVAGNRKEGAMENQNNIKSWGDTVREFRAARGLSQVAFAKTIGKGLNRATVEKWEGGFRTPPEYARQAYIIAWELLFPVESEKKE